MVDSKVFGLGLSDDTLYAERSGNSEGSAASSLLTKKREQQARPEFVTGSQFFGHIAAARAFEIGAEN